ncbi:hypothetical protein G6O69_25570 [Pseudenhygromyxa sp. WMMC2535]|uniref:hypothetical protein n=1 Tax=Pseudenhygromyxa sp. WMMC2535 TaxID=2712867 RepID=UPI001551E042|nr:hypothetical protein [Pseudenhygromyxa sp. WMMC2535]NVB41234.1 hypothetical protein [Pseudenhygromyxa sp. WMMC2535]
MRSARSLTLALVFATPLAFVGGRVEAAPVEASSSASASEDSRQGARERALTQARRVALEQAIATIDVAVDEQAVAQVLARAEAWTAGYRVLEVREDAGEVEVRVEVEIDLPRLRKRVAATTTAQRQAGFSWAGASVEGCAGLNDEALRGPLTAYGVVRDANANTQGAADQQTTLRLSLRCRDRGAVSHTHVRAAGVEVVAETSGAVELRAEISAQGFAEELDAATAIALDRAIGELADELAEEARGALELRVEQPWPAARITVLEARLRDAFIGVDAAELAGIAADGSAVIRITGSVDAQRLGQQLQGASFPGFGLVGLRLDSAHALRVRMQ